jgi:hypothetical protein
LNALRQNGQCQNLWGVEGELDYSESYSYPNYFHPEIFKIFAIDNLSNNDLRKPIVDYLKNPSGTVSRKTKYITLSYVVIGNELFKETFEGVLLQCINENEAYLTIFGVHSGSCGFHQGGHKMKWLIFRQGSYWPSIWKDCIEFAKGCQACQKHAVIQHAPEVNCIP